MVAVARAERVKDLVIEIETLAAANTELDWDIPSHYDKLITNAERIDAIEHELETMIANPLGPISVSPPPPSDFTPVRRGHLTLVHSRRE